MMATQEARSAGGIGEEKTKKRRRYSEAQDLALLQTITANAAHLAPYGEKMKRFADTADRLNASQIFPWPVDAKNCLERFNLLVELHKKNDRKSRASRGKEYTPRDTLLDDITDQMADFKASREAEKASNRRKEDPLGRKGSEPDADDGENSHLSADSNRKRSRPYDEDNLLRQLFDRIVEHELSKSPEATAQNTETMALFRKQSEILSQQTTILNQQSAAIAHIAEVLAAMREDHRENGELLKKLLK